MPRHSAAQHRSMSLQEILHRGLRSGGPPALTAGVTVGCPGAGSGGVGMVSSRATKSHTRPLPIRRVLQWRRTCTQAPALHVLADALQVGTCWYNPALNGCPLPRRARSFIAVGMFVARPPKFSLYPTQADQRGPCSLHATPGSRKRATSAPQTCARGVRTPGGQGAHEGFKQPRLIASTA